MANVKGTMRQNLIAAHPGNLNAAQQGTRSPRMREPRAREITDEIMSASWAAPVDELGAEEVGKLIALIESLDAAIAAKGVTGVTGDVRRTVEVRIRASAQLASWLDRYALNPRSRAEIAEGLAGTTLSQAVRKLREAS